MAAHGGRFEANNASYGQLVIKTQRKVMGRGKTGFLIVGALSCLVVGAGLEQVRQAVWVAVPEVAPLPEVLQPSLGKTPERLTPDGYDANVRAALDTLHKRVADLEKMLAARDEDLAALKKVKSSDVIASRRSGREDFRQRMEQLKKENPQHYAELQKQREEFQQRMEQEKQENADFLSSFSTQTMSEAQKANHDKLLETLAKIEALRAQQEQSGADSSTEAVQAAHQAVRAAEHELGALYEVEREYLLQQAATAAGYEGDDAAKFVDYIQETIQSTTMHRGSRGMGGPPPGM